MSLALVTESGSTPHGHAPSASIASCPTRAAAHGGDDSRCSERDSLCATLSLLAAGEHRDHARRVKRAAPLRAALQPLRLAPHVLSRAHLVPRQRDVDDARVARVLVPRVGRAAGHASL